MTVTGDGRARAPRTPRTRRPRSDGERSREAILAEAERLATIEGLGGLSIGRLADAVGMSKSGLFAHFGCKEELQLATVERASARFDAHVIDRAAAAPTAVEHLRRLVDGYLHWVQVDSYPGGCFFASVLAEVDMQPGPLRDELVRFLADWLGQLEATIAAAQADGAIDAADDPKQIAFEVEAALFLANAQWVVMGTSEPVDRARRAIARRLALAL